MADNPRFRALLEEMQALHNLKNGDYARDDDAYSNFKEAAQVAAGFEGTDAVFAVLIGIKLARLRELTRARKTPNNESIADTRRDLAMYAALWASYALPFGYDDSRAHPRACACGKSLLVNGARCRNCELEVSTK